MKFFATPLERFAAPLERLGIRSRNRQLPSPPATGAATGPEQSYQLDVDHAGNRILVVVEQSWLLDVACSRQLGQQLQQLISDVHPAVLEVDLTRVARLTSEGLNQLIQVNCHARAQGTDLVLVNLSQTLAEVFRRTRLDRLFTVKCTQLP